jgi:hypothetical protein
VALNAGEAGSLLASSKIGSRGGSEQVEKLSQRFCFAVGRISTAHQRAFAQILTIAA